MLIAAYLAWGAAMLAVAIAATWALLRLWGGAIEREVAEALEHAEGHRRAGDARAVLAREVNHRAKNMLAVVQAVIRLTTAPDRDSFAAAVSGRVAALARAHDLLSDRNWNDVALADLARAAFAAYPPERVGLEGPPVRIAAGLVQPLAITLHELAANAAAHGALMEPGAGRVSVRWELTEDARTLRLDWQERDGPPIAEPPTRQGFGARIIDASIRSQLGGTIVRDWPPTGLRCTMTLPMAA